MEFIRRRWSKLLISLLAGVILFYLGMFAATGVPWPNSNANKSTAALAADDSIVRPNNIADIVQQASPAVVKIDTVIQQQVQVDPFMNDPFFRQFFGGQVPQQQSQVEQGIGSGFIVSSDGYILTNEHVIDGASKITVTLSDNSTFPATVIGADHDLDLAIVKINANKSLPTLKLGNSDQARVGDWVIAIGNPYGLDHTVTVGVISAKGRPIQVEDRSYKNLLQTDASINPGNSGGPLLDLNGNVIGINTAVSTQAQGIGFAIPVSTVQSVYQQLLTKGKVSHPFLGVQVEALTKDLATQLKVNETNGAVVAGVVQGSPADKAGLQQGDVIVEFNRQQVKDDQDLVDKVATTKPGDQVLLLVDHGGQNKFITVTIGDKNSQ